MNSAGSPLCEEPGGVGEDDVIEFSIGVCAYNEEGNIERCIRSIYTQETPGFRLMEVIVVSSGSTDRTDEIVRSLMAEHGDIVLLPQESREGKNSAINLYLDRMTSGIAVMLNADNIFAGDRSLASLLEPLRDPGVGMVGGHPLPTNDPSTRIGYACHLLWDMHHHIALITPKIGELVAFRDIGTRLRTDLQSDEAIIRMELEAAGYRCAYAPDATVYNHGPETEEDFIKQRVRVNVGEVTMRRVYGYSEPSWNKITLIKAALQSFRDLGFHPFRFVYASLLEARARRMAEEHVANGEDTMSCWDPVASTKRVRSDRAALVQDLTRLDDGAVGQHGVGHPGAPADPAPLAEYDVRQLGAGYLASRHRQDPVQRRGGHLRPPQDHGVGEPAPLGAGPGAQVERALDGAAGGLPVPGPVLRLRHGEVGAQQVPGPAHVHPDAVDRVPLDPPAVGHQPGHQVLGEVEERPLGDVGEHVPLQDVDARVDQVGEDLLRPGLLPELQYAPLPVRAGYAELAGVLHRRQRYGGRRPGVQMGADLPGHVDGREHVPVGRHERPVEAVLDQLHGAAGAHGLVLVGVLDAQAQVGAVADGLPHLVGPVAAGEDHLADPALGQGPEQVPQAGPVRHWEDYLRPGLGQRQEPGAPAPDHDDGLPDRRVRHPPASPA